MKGLWRCFFLVSTLTLLGCQGELPADDPYQKDDPYAPCTDLNKCCSKDEIVCKGNVDDGVTCTCRGLWDCSKNPNKCESDLPDPDGKGGWDCTWTEFGYKCTKAGTAGAPPDGYNNWNCKFIDAESKWECKRNTVPNPTNTPGGAGVWKCSILLGKLVCERESKTTGPPPGDGQWECKNGKCTKKDENNGLPPGGGTYKCHLATDANGKKIWVCVGDSATPPSGGGWTCKKLKTEFGKDIYRCEKPEGPKDIPPGGGWYSCVKGTEFGGTKCTKVPTKPEPPTPEKGGKCAVGEKLWCDGVIYCGWGMVDCDPATGKWKMTNINGKSMLDCSEKTAKGKVPNTICACYHYYYNPSCCERPDCIVPAGTSGQVCKASNGGLCDYCNPQNPECKETGAKCIVTNAHETFCGRDCSSQTCPSGYTCMNVKLKVGSTKQCVPSDYSCYY